MQTTIDRLTRLLLFVAALLFTVALGYAFQVVFADELEPCDWQSELDVIEDQLEPMICHDEPINVLCMLGDRFEVKLDWNNGETWIALGIFEATNDGVGLIHFYRADQIIGVLRILDGTSSNGLYWVTASLATDQGVSIWICDTWTGKTKQYIHRPNTGRPMPTIVDIEAFAP